SGGAGFTHRGPFTLSISYSYSENASNSYGERALRHRLSVSAGTRIFWDLTVLAQVAVQKSDFPQGIVLTGCVKRPDGTTDCSGQLKVAEDEDNHNSASLKLVRPITETVDAELKLAWYQDRFPGNDLDYSRALGWFGLTWSL